VSCALVVFPVLGKANKMLIQCLPPSNEEVLSGPTGGGGGATASFPFESIYIFTYPYIGRVDDERTRGTDVVPNGREWVQGRTVQMC